jgi:hypothetical protein
MKKIIHKAAKNRKKLSKIGIASMMLISFELAFSAAAGYLTARFVAGRETKERGLFPSLVIPLGLYKIHLHHWFLAGIILAVTLLMHTFLFTQNSFYGFFGGIMIQGVVQYQDWSEVVIKG